MYLFVDRYNPKNHSEIDFQEDLSKYKHGAR